MKNSLLKPVEFQDFGARSTSSPTARAGPSSGSASPSLPSHRFGKYAALAALHDKGMEAHAARQTAARR
jgi:hypothetical protein